MNVELAYEILEILQTMKEAISQMKKEYSKGQDEDFLALSKDLKDALIAVQEIVRREKEENSGIRLADACTCALASLKDILLLLKDDSDKVEWKLEYELEAIIETAMMQFYYWGIVKNYPENRGEFLQFLENTDTFSILKKCDIESAFSCDLTIVITGYNKLDYTQKCVESVVNNIPKGLTYELILLNHGSNDGTKEYFENVEGAKVINVAVNGAVPGVVFKAFHRGKYSLSVSNDIIIGENAIENLYRCAVEHPNYGYIVPTTPAVSNIQTIPASYNSPEEFIKFTINNNIYDERRHEERVRLCNPVEIMPTLVRAKSNLALYENKMCSGQVQSFPDDKNSLWMRRNGYKCILAKDAFCHHFGSVTLKEDLGNQKQQNEFYLEGRKSFFARYGVDPWGCGVCFDYELFKNWNADTLDEATILGINCGLGSNSLKIKEVLKEKGGHNVVLHNATQDGRYLVDLKGVSDDAFLFWDLGDMIAQTGKSEYTYIIVEEEIQGNNGENSLEKILNAGFRCEQLIWRAPNKEWYIVK